MAKKTSKTKSEALPIESPEVATKALETAALNNIMGSSVEKAFNMAIENGAAVANPNSFATKVANVDALPTTQYWGTKNADPSEAYRPFKTRASFVQARKINQVETVETQFGTEVGNPGDYRVVHAGGKQTFMKEPEFRKIYEEAH